MENNKNSRHERPSALRFYISGALFLAYSLIFPFYSLVHIALGLALFGACFALCTRFLPKTAVQAEEKPVKTGDQALDRTVEKGVDYDTANDLGKGHGVCKAHRIPVLPYRKCRR